jgi:hypothetical protein
MLKIFTSRQRKLKLIYHTWKNKDRKVSIRTLNKYIFLTNVLLLSGRSVTVDRCISTLEAQHWCLMVQIILHLIHEKLHFAIVISLVMMW